VLQDKGGYDEILVPNGDNVNMAAGACISGDSCATHCNDGGVECWQLVDEGIDSPDGNVLLSTTAGTVSRSWLDFEDPSENPSTATNAQRLQLLVSMCIQDEWIDGPPYCIEDGDGCVIDIYLYMICNNVRQSPPILNAYPFPGGGDNLDELIEVDFTMDIDCLADGTDTGFIWNVSGCEWGGSDERVTCLESIQWLVKH
jgi:hypothetical protein